MLLAHLGCADGHSMAGEMKDPEIYARPDGTAYVSLSTGFQPRGATADLHVLNRPVEVSQPSRHDFDQC